MLAMDGTAHHSLEYQWCIVERLSAARLAEITAQAAPAPVSNPGRLPEIYRVAYTPSRDSAFAGMEAYSYDNWDCEGAVAISTDAIRWAKEVTSRLAQSLPNPDVAPAPDGSVCMEWTRGEDLVWADIQPEGKLLTLTKFSGQRHESAFDIGDAGIEKYLAAALTRLYA